MENGIFNFYKIDNGNRLTWVTWVGRLPSKSNITDYGRSAVVLYIGHVVADSDSCTYRVLDRIELIVHLGQPQTSNYLILLEFKVKSQYCKVNTCSGTSQTSI